MCTKQELAEIMRQLMVSIESIFGDAVSEFILFGSYARNEADDTSDIDVMILLDIPRDEIPAYRRKVAQVASALLLEHDIIVSPVLENRAFYERNRQLYPFFRNVDQEGVRYVA